MVWKNALLPCKYTPRLCDIINAKKIILQCGRILNGARFQGCARPCSRSPLFAVRSVVAARENWLYIFVSNIIAFSVLSPFYPPLTLFYTVFSILYFKGVTIFICTNCTKIKNGILQIVVPKVQNQLDSTTKIEIK